MDAESPPMSHFAFHASRVFVWAQEVATGCERCVPAIAVPLLAMSDDVLFQVERHVDGMSSKIREGKGGRRRNDNQGRQTPG
jgi:hypothetical protein